jgi:hypothetical protein
VVVPRPGKSVNGCLLVQVTLARQMGLISVKNKTQRIIWLALLTQNLSGHYGARTLSTTVHYIPCIKINDKKIMKRTLNFFRSINPCQYKVLDEFLHGSIAETRKFLRIS